MRDVDQAREQGDAVGPGRVERGIIGIAAGAPGCGDGAVAGLTVWAPSRRLSAAGQKAIIEALMVATASLGEAIGRR